MTILLCKVGDILNYKSSPSPLKSKSHVGVAWAACGIFSSISVQLETVEESF